MYRSDRSSIAAHTLVLQATPKNHLSRYKQVILGGLVGMLIVTAGCGIASGAIGVKAKETFSSSQGPGHKGSQPPNGVPSTTSTTTTTLPRAEHESQGYSSACAWAGGICRGPVHPLRRSETTLTICGSITVQVPVLAA